MLTTAILLLVAAQELDTSFCGVWATRQDEVFVMHEPGKATFQTLNKFGWLPEMSKAPDGNYFGHWYTAERLTILIDSSRAAEGAQVLDNPATAPTGEAYLRFGLRDSRGITSTIVIAMRDKFKNQKFGGELRYVMPLTHLTVQGTYQNGPLTATIEDRPGKDSMLGGTLTALGRTMFIKGKRRGARAGFELLEPSSGKRVCTGYLEWSPTADVVRQMGPGKRWQTDRLSILINGGPYPNGYNGFVNLKAQ